MPDSHSSCNEAALINRILPVEILIMIFLLVVPASFENPYAYLPLSWVCRHWRSIVLDTPKFWTVITHNCNNPWAHEPHELTQQVVLRSKSHEVDIAWCPPHCHDRSFTTSCILSSKESQIRTLFFEGPQNFQDEKLPRTQLENLIFSRTPVLRWSPERFYNFLSAVNPRFIELPFSLLYKQISQSLHRVEWLRLDAWCFDNVNSSIVYHVLENLPNLRILNLFSKWGSSYFRKAALPSITLLNLRMFSLDPLRGDFCSIQTPALSYFAVTPCPSKIYSWDHITSIDLSMTKCFRIALCQFQSKSRHHRFPVACVSTGHSEEDCHIANNFHAPVAESGVSMDNLWMLPPENSFHVSFKWALNYETLFSHLKLGAKNLIELILDCQPMQFHDWENERYQGKYHNFLTGVLDNFDTIIHLTVLHGRSLASICDFITDGRKLPRLERLTYYSPSDPFQGATALSTHMAMIQKARIDAASEPLKVIELKNVLFISPTQVEEIEKLGIQLIQTSSIGVA